MSLMPNLSNLLEISRSRDTIRDFFVLRRYPSPVPAAGAEPSVPAARSFLSYALRRLRSGIRRFCGYIDGGNIYLAYYQFVVSVGGERMRLSLRN